jgi:hypothetical protein
LTVRFGTPLLPSWSEALPHAVGAQISLGVELAEQQRAVQLPVHLHAPCEQGRADPKPAGVLGHGNRLDLREGQHRQQNGLPAVRQQGQPGDDRPRRHTKQRAHDVAFIVPRHQRQRQLARRPLKFAGRPCPLETFTQICAIKDVQ